MIKVYLNHAIRTRFAPDRYKEDDWFLKISDFNSDRISELFPGLNAFDEKVFIHQRH
jgi:hypothetical protein